VEGSVRSEAETAAVVASMAVSIACREVIHDHHQVLNPPRVRLAERTNTPSSANTGPNGKPRATRRGRRAGEGLTASAGTCSKMRTSAANSV
jgi:hypothetical protein